MSAQRTAMSSQYPRKAYRARRMAHPQKSDGAAHHSLEGRVQLDEVAVVMLEYQAECQGISCTFTTLAFSPRLGLGTITYPSHCDNGIPATNPPCSQVMPTRRAALWPILDLDGEVVAAGPGTLWRLVVVGCVRRVR